MYYLFDMIEKKTLALYMSYPKIMKMTKFTFFYRIYVKFFSVNYEKTKMYENFTSLEIT